MRQYFICVCSLEKLINYSEIRKIRTIGRITVFHKLINFISMRTPDEIYGQLFEAIQMSEVFPDSKTFVDSIPKGSPEEILSAYALQSRHPGFDLKEFVHTHFSPPVLSKVDFSDTERRTIRQHIEFLWDALQRKADKDIAGSSLIPLPKSYIVPGGRFGEIYYWDSYFTMLGLLVSGKVDVVRNMIDNFAHLIETAGHIPNGNRSYFLSRSQPPFFCLMVELLADATDSGDVLVRYLPAMKKEYAFWMDGATKSETFRRVVHLEDGSLLNRYWDDSPLPRQESYKEDVELAASSGRNKTMLFRDLRAACESGWDFSSRWLEDVGDLATTITSDIIPVDLNCLLYANELIIARALNHGKNRKNALDFIEFASKRKSAILHYCWNENTDTFCDYNFNKKKNTDAISMAAMFPLYIRIASKEHADRTIKTLRSKLLKPGGWVTTDINSGQQWDAPNGWAPLQWIAYKALTNYGFDDLAREGAQRWVDNCSRVFNNIGKLVEKYNVLDTSLKAGGGEYPVQDGFGWTNGVYLRMSEELSKI
jgi:alpha,alpha-trehalase